MKPISTNNLSAWGYVGLFILFSLPYVGNLALIICAFFVKDHAVKSFARALLILSLISIVFLVVVALLGIVNLEDFNFDFGGDGGIEVFNSIRGYFGF